MPKKLVPVAKTVAENSFVEYGRDLWRRDLDHGFGFHPGRHDIAILCGDERLPFTITIGADGYRICAPAGEVSRERKELWIFGCSFTFGWPLSDHETMPWLLQTRFPNLTVRNYAIPGYATVNAVVQLKALLEQRVPETVIISYNWFHTSRNVATPEWLRQGANASDAFADLAQLRAGIAEDGELYVGQVPYWSEGLLEVDPRIVHIDEWYRLHVTIKLFEYLRALQAQYGFRCIVAIQDGEAIERPGGAAIRRAGFSTERLVTLTPELSCEPFDNHPNASAHRLWADQLEAALKGPATILAGADENVAPLLHMDFSSQLIEKERQIQLLAAAAEERRIALEEKEFVIGTLANVAEERLRVMDRLHNELARVNRKHTAS